MRKLTAAAALAAAAFVAVGAAAPAGAQDGNGTVVVIHAIPDTPVDVYVNGDRTLDDFQPGTVTDPLSLPAGDYDLALTAPDAADASSPILEATASVAAGGNYTIVAHLTEGGDPTITPYANDFAATKTKAGEGGVVVRHDAAAPAVDVLVGGEAVVSNLANPDSAGPLYLPAGTISASVAATGTTDPVIGPADVPVEEGKVTIVYAWGSLEAGNLAVAVQSIEVGAEAAEETTTTTAAPQPESMPMPNRVDTGDSGLATDQSGPSTALLITVAGLALAAGTTGAVSLARARRNG